MITYSDLITLLLIFFVIMYAMSNINTIKFMSLSQSLAAALHHNDQIPLNGTGTTALITAANPTSGDQSTTKGSASQDQQLDNLYTQVKSYITAHHLQGNVTILNQQRGVQITLRDVVLFESGQATIKPQARQLIAGLVPFFKAVPNNIVIEGYTDNRPIDTPEFPSNWELSSARAIGVVRLLAADGIDPARLSGVGYGQYHPVVPNDTPEHRQMNRRINIVILRTGTSPDTSASTSASTASATSSLEALANGTSAAANAAN
ncbi:OmpA family protein [Alicyclobacillus cycloheptanicus]|nr:OmpA family protein [Alicyclobacillus cycloheptanicus]